MRFSSASRSSGVNALGDVEVVVEAVGDRRSDAELGLGEHLLHRLGQHVGRRVPDDAAARRRCRRRPASPRHRRPASSSGRAAGRRRRGRRRSRRLRPGWAGPRRGPPPQRSSRQRPGSGLLGRGWGRRSSVTVSNFVGVYERDHAIGAAGQSPTPIGLFSHGCSIPTSSPVQSSAPSSHSVAATISAVNKPPRICTNFPCRPNQSMTLS